MRASEFSFRDVLKAGDVIAWPQGSGEPLDLTRALMSQRRDLPPVTVFVGMSSSTTLRPDHADAFVFSGLNGAGTNRVLTEAGMIDIVPVSVSAIPAPFLGNSLRLDVVLIQVRPHRQSGMLSLGVVADFVGAMIESARLVIAVVNENLPRTAQDALIARDAIDVLLEGGADVIDMPDPEPQGQDFAIADIIASLIPDRSIIQLGIGTLPVPVARALRGHRDLGVHSGVISDAIVDLMQSGVVTNAHKPRDAGVTVTGCLFGTRKLYDFADENDSIHLRSAEYTHNPGVLASLPQLFTINSAIEVDLSGQLNSESAAGRYIGAVGGQVDFVRGGRTSVGGRSIIALPSTAAKGKTSRIVASLGAAPVTTGRYDVDLIVTEFGVADLRGQPLSERARRLAAVAHPRFREELIHAARGRGPAARAQSTV